MFINLELELFDIIGLNLETANNISNEEESLKLNAFAKIANAFIIFQSSREFPGVNNIFLVD